MLSKVTFTPSVGSAIDIHAATGNYQISKADGIVGPSSPRDVFRTAPGRDGVLDDTRYLGERNITLEGEIIGSSQSDVWTKGDALSAAFQSTLLSKGTLTITLPNGTTQRQTSVVLTGAAQPSFEGSGAYLQYQVNFRAPDPRWYGTTLNTSTATIATTVVATSTSTNVTNAGNAPVSPRFEWTAGTGRLLDYVTVTVPSAYSTVSPQGSTIVLDASATASILAANDYIDCGLRASSTLNLLSPTTEWPVLYPGTSSWTWTQQLSGGSSASSTCTLSWRDAWW